jgi:hypothetical protein
MLRHVALMLIGAAAAPAGETGRIVCPTTPFPVAKVLYQTERYPVQAGQSP